MSSWPRSAYVTVLLVMALCGAAVPLVYTQTREAYRAVGVTDGQIHQREQTMNAIMRAAPVGDCKQGPWVSPPIELLAVKAELLYMGVAADGSVKFCR
jgi:hypothetical protein